jgi:hypothetical protein
MENVLADLIQLIGQNMPEIRLVDEDYGQLENLDENGEWMYPLVFPAVLIEEQETAWSNIESLNQKGETTIRVRLLIDCYDDTHYTSGTIEKVNERMQMVHDLHKLIQGHRIALDCNNDDGVLIRTRSRFYTGNHGIKVYESYYSTTVTDIISQREKKKITTIRLSPL